MANNIFPAHAGELLLRPYVIKQKEGAAISVAIVLIERMFWARTTTFPPLLR
jgi:hypothetical protein